MMYSYKNILVGLVAVFALWVVFDAIRFGILFRKSKVLSANSSAYERILANTKMKILVLGDSTAVGTGTNDPKYSTAGRLGALYPSVSIENKAKNGLKLEGLLEIVEKQNAERNDSKQYDIILVQIGANDIIRLTKMDEIKLSAEKIIEKLAPKTKKLIILHSGNIGNSKFFPLYVRSWLKNRSYDVREIYQELAKKYGVQYIDLIDAPSDELFKQDPKRYYADDMLHLNDEGYGLWFEEIKKKL